MIKRKLKICRNCNEAKYLFSRSLCEYCWKKEYAKPINKQSEKEKERQKKYKDLRLEYLELHPICELCGLKQATEIHHRKKRTGEDLFKFFMAVDRDCHNYIHDHPEESYLKEWLI